MKDAMIHQLDTTKAFPWKYDMTWMADDNNIECIEAEVGRNDEIDVKEMNDTDQWLMAFCEENQVQLIRREIGGKEISIRIGSQEHINLGKIAKTLQKQLGKKIDKDLSKWRFQLMTLNEGKAKDNVRIQNILDHLWSTEYYDLDEGLSDEELKKLKAYLEDRQLGMIEKGEQVFLVDREALALEINLNCFECTKKHQYGCCCGSPCGLSETNMDLFDRHALAMEEAVKTIDEEQYKRLQENGGFMTANGKIKAYDGHCSLLIQEEGIYKCIAHKYALENQIAPYEICPLSCLMYPLEIIELFTNKRKKVVLLTSVVEEGFAKEFGRWGSYESLEVELRCIHKNKHNEIFKKEHYKPVYEVNQGLLSHEFGKAVYEGIKKLV